MCGISGYIANKNFLNENAIKNTLKLMKKRGPDSQNHFNFTTKNKDIGLLHSRLNIIDINKRSNQPFFFDDYVLIFNGEIYNYIELREFLKKRGHFFKTNSDTEVLIKSYMEFGEDCVNQFVGMWAFAIWDKKKNNFFLSRDNFGEKPLYYYIDKNNFVFGSEIKFIKSICKKKFKINQNQIYKNLFLGYKSLTKSNETFYETIINLENGSNITVDLSLNLTKKKYWLPKLNINKKMTSQDAIEGTKHYLKESMRLRLRSDVPIAFCLSGGVDSTLLASIAKKEFNKKINTFSIIDKDLRYNEEININITNKNLNSKNYKIFLEGKKKKFLSRIKKLTNHHDGPIATNSYYIHSFLSEEISKNGFKVAISGTGADELFTGYYDHFLLHFENQKKSKNFKKLINDWKKYIYPILNNKNLKDPFLYIKDNEDRSNVYEEKFNIKSYSTKKRNLKFDEINYCGELLRNRMLNELFNEVVPIILKHDDLNSMLFSVENRSPYLDKFLVEFALTIPPNLLISDGYQKKILRDASKKYISEKIYKDRIKKGFNSSISSLIQIKKPNDLDKFINKNDPINNLINIKMLKKNINFDKIPNHLSKFLFSIISTNLFLENN